MRTSPPSAARPSTGNLERSQVPEHLLLGRRDLGLDISQAVEPRVKRCRQGIQPEGRWPGVAFILDKRIDTLGSGYAIHLTAEELAAMGLTAGDDIEVHIDRKGDVAWDRIPTASPEEKDHLAVFKPSW